MTALHRPRRMSLPNAVWSEPRPQPDPGPQPQQKCDWIAQTVAGVFAVPLSELSAPSRRSRRAALARQIAMYLAHVGFGLSLTQVGRGFGRDRSTAAHACKVVESLRDDRHLDRTLDALEQACRRQLTALSVEPLQGARR